MIKLEDLDGLKLVKVEYIANELDTAAALENAFTQGSQDWGVKRDVGVHLALATSLRSALEYLAVALSLEGQRKEAANALKGAQMELGRTKKMLKEARAQIADLLRQDDDFKHRLTLP